MDITYCFLSDFNTYDLRKLIIRKMETLYISEFGDYNDTNNSISENPFNWINNQSMYYSTDVILALDISGIDITIVGFLVFDHYFSSNSILITYCAVDKGYRRLGITKTLFNMLLTKISNFPSVFSYSIFVEFEKTEDPNDVASLVWKSLGAVPLQFDYIQPPLSDLKTPCHDLVLSSFTQNISNESVVEFLEDFYVSITHSKTNTIHSSEEFCTMMRSLNMRDFADCDINNST